MLFSEENDRKCFSMKWSDKSDVHCAKPSCAEVLPCTKKCVSEKPWPKQHVSLSQHEMLLDSHVQGSSLAQPLQGSKRDLLLNSITARRLERMFRELGLKTLR